MQEPIEIENIEELRHREGIHDAELRDEVRGLRAGDFVNLTFLAGRNAELLMVRITSIRGHALRGKVAAKPASAGLSELQLGARVAFTTAHIHSLAKEQPEHKHGTPAR